MTDNITQLPLYRRGAELASKHVQAGVDIPAVERLQFFQTLSRHWRRYLTPSELSLALYIVDRSIGWGKPSFSACVDNILYGNKEFAGLGMSRRSYFRAVKSLQAKGMIVRRGSRERTSFRINMGWKPEETCAPIAPVAE